MLNAESCCVSGQMSNALPAVTPHVNAFALHQSNKPESGMALHDNVPHGAVRHRQIPV